MIQKLKHFIVMIGASIAAFALIGLITGLTGLFVKLLVITFKYGYELI